MNIRDALPADWPTIERLLVACELPVAGAREHLATFSVCDDGEVIGCAGAEAYGDIALLRSVAVARSARKSGIARALIQRTLARLAERHVTTVALLTTDAERYFAQLGFRTITREDLPPALDASAELKGACPASAIAMIRRHRA